MSSSSKIFSLEGKGLKLDTAGDLEPHIAELRANDVEEVRLLGNTLGVGACKLLGEVLATKKNLSVSTAHCNPYTSFARASKFLIMACRIRLPIWLTFLLVASSARFPKPYLRFLLQSSTSQSSIRSI